MAGATKKAELREQKEKTQKDTKGPNHEGLLGHFEDLNSVKQDGSP